MNNNKNNDDYDACKEQSEQMTQAQKTMQFIKFGLFSISAGIIQFASFTLLFEVFKFVYWPSYLIALVLSIVWNFTFNRRYTFKSTANIPKAMMLVFLYYAVFTPLSTWWGDALTKLEWNEYLVLAGTMVINFITEFLYQRYFVFNKTINTNDLAKEKKRRKETSKIQKSIL